MLDRLILDGDIRQDQSSSSEVSGILRDVQRLETWAPTGLVSLERRFGHTHAISATCRREQPVVDQDTQTHGSITDGAVGRQFFRFLYGSVSLGCGGCGSRNSGPGDDACGNDGAASCFAGRRRVGRS